MIFPKYIYAVAVREWRRMASRRIWFAAAVCAPLLALLFMATVFGNGTMQGIAIAVVDNDCSSLSRRVIRAVAASGRCSVVNGAFASEADARLALERGEVVGYVVIPYGFERDVYAGLRPEVAYYYNNVMMAAGGEVSGALTAALTGVQAGAATTYNTALNYTAYLAQPMFFAMLHILLMLTSLYAIGSERGVGEWLRVAGGSALSAVAGKLLPYFVLFSLMGVAANSVLFGIMALPVDVSLWKLDVLVVLFVAASQALAVAVHAATPVIGMSISGVSMIGSLGVSLSGVTFPLSGMYLPVRIAAALLPISHFTEAVQALLYRHAGLLDVAPRILILMLYPVVSLLLVRRVFPPGPYGEI